MVLVEEIRQSEVWRRIEAAAERHVEVPFSIAVSADEIPAGVELDVGPGRAVAEAGQAGGEARQASGSPPVLIRGQIDAVFREKAAAPARRYDRLGDRGLEDHVHRRVGGKETR